MKNILIFLCVFVFLITLSNTHFTCECGLSNNEIHFLENVKTNTCVDRCNDLVSNPCNTRNSKSCSCNCDNKLVECTRKTTHGSDSSISSTTSKTSGSSTSETSGTTTDSTTSSGATGSSGPSGTGSGSNPYTGTSGSGSSGSGTGGGTSASATTVIDTGSQPPVSGNGCDDIGTPYISITDKLGEKIVLLQNECQTFLCPCSNTVLNVTAHQVIFDQNIVSINY